MSSFESMSVTLDPSHWALHTSQMSQRNYPCDNIIDVYFGNQTFGPNGDAATFRKDLWFCLLGQALNIKSNVEVRRSKNSFGDILWQYNEIWPTGGWGSVEYGTLRNGQVIGGRWKPLQYWLRKSIFSDIISTCGPTAQCYVKNDSPSAFAGTVTVSAIHFATGQSTDLTSFAVNLPGSAHIQWFCAKANTDGTCISLTNILTSAQCPTNVDCLLMISVVDNNKNLATENVVVLAPINNLKLPTANVTFKIDSTSPKVTVTSNNFALYVTLTTQAAGRFSDNAFILLPGVAKEIDFVPFGSYFDLSVFQSTLRVEHARSYL